MPLNNISPIPFPPQVSDWAGVNEYMKNLYLTLSNWHTALSSTEFVGGAGYIRIEDRPPMASEGNDRDIWVEF